MTGGPSPQQVKSRDICAQRKSHRAPKPEGHMRRRRRSLRFFSMSSSSSGSPALSVTPCDNPEKSLSSFGNIHRSQASVWNSDSDSSLKIPFILIEEPGRVVIGSEVDDDPELLNCSFVENLDAASGSECEETIAVQQQSEDAGEDDRWVVVDDGNPEILVEYDATQKDSQGPEVECGKTGGGVQMKEQGPQAIFKNKKRKSSSKKPSGPRRSISMPEVALDPHPDEVEEVQKEVTMNESTFHDVWSTSVSLPLKKSGGKGKEGRERRRRYGTFHERKKDRGSDPDQKKASLRLSMAERFRSFSALASFLRTPTARLRRQGARRFSRSFSDEAVQEDQQAFLELNDELTDSEEPNEQLLPDRSPSPPTPPAEDLSLIESSQKSGAAGTECVLSEMLKEEALDLDHIFARQCHVTERQRVREKDTVSCWDVQCDGFLPLSQRRTSFNSPADSCTFTASESDPLSPQYEMSASKTFSCLSFDGVFSISGVSEKCSLSLDLSPPSFQFRPLGSRRSYRDSPRWPSHDVRMSAWKPLPL